MKSRLFLPLSAGVLVAIGCAGAWLWNRRTAATSPTPVPYVEAMRRLHGGQTRDAETALRQCTLVAPLFAPAHAELGNLYLLQHSLPRAIQELEAAAYLDPAQPNVFARLAQARLDARRTDEAREAVEEALRREPRSAYALTIQGELQLRDDNLTGALAAFQGAVQAEPTFSLPYLKAGYVLVKLQKLEEAETVLKEGLKYDANNPALHAQLAETYFLRPKLSGSAALAEQQYQLAIPNNPAAATANSRLGELAMRQGDVVLARRHFEQALRLDPSQMNALYGMTQLEAKAGNKERREALLSRLQEIRKSQQELANLKAKAQTHPLDAALACRAARFGLEHGLIKEAERQIERAVRWHPDHREARQLRAALYEAEGRTEEARNELKVASRLHD